MARRVICIARVLGAGAVDVGKGVADELSYKLVDDEILQLAAANSDIAIEELASVERRGAPVSGGLSADQLVVFPYEDQGVATLEDGIYTLEASLQDPEMVDKLMRFVKASMKGWEWSVKNPDEAAEIVLENDETGAQTEKHQKRMMGEIAKLVGENPKGTGWLDPEDYDRTVKILLSGQSDPVITKDPQGAWTHDIMEKAKGS